MKSSNRGLIALIVVLALVSVYAHQFSHHTGALDEDCVLCQMGDKLGDYVAEKVFSFLKTFTYANHLSEIFLGYSSQIQSHHKTRAPPLFFKG